jgi:hypothetical protein
VLHGHAGGPNDEKAKGRLRIETLTELRLLLKRDDGVFTYEKSRTAPSVDHLSTLRRCVEDAIGPEYTIEMLLKAER